MSTFYDRPYIIFGEIANLNRFNIDFITYCIGNLARRLGLSQQDVYNRLKSSGILYGYIVPSYDVLHTFSARNILWKTLSHI